MDRRSADALHGIRLFPCRHSPRHRLRRLRAAMKLRYFAWIRERSGRAEEEVTAPPEVRTVSDLAAWLAGRGEEYAYAFENPQVVRAAIDRRHVKPGDLIEGAGEIAF